MAKTVIVTGASRGIGAACALAFGAAGYRVAVCCRTRLAQAQAVAGQICAAGGTACAFAADVADEEAVKTLFAQVRKALGDADVLVNNAGIAQQKLFTDITAAEWDAMMNTHARGAFLCCREALPAMLHNKWGRIINIASMWGQVGASCEVHYSAAKAALIGLTKALAAEEAPSGVTVNCVAPGVIDTDMMAGFTDEEKAQLAAETPLGRLGTPQDVARAVLFFASEEAQFITGTVLSVSGGFVME